MLRELSVEGVIRIHDRIIDEIGGTPGVLFVGNIEHAVDIVRKGMGDDEDIIIVASRMMAHIITTHPFVDGNKRSAFESAYHLLRWRGFDLDMPSDDAVEMTLKVANGKMDLEGLADLLESNCKRIYPSAADGRLVEEEKKQYRTIDEEYWKEFDAEIMASIEKHRKILEELAKH